MWQVLRRNSCPRPQRAIATTRASRGTATAGKAAGPTSCGQILLDQAVLEALLATYADTEVVSAAIERWRSRTAEQGPDSASQLRRLEAEISGTESAVQRYYNAFENGRLPETRFIGRVEALERRLTELRAKLEELRDSASNIHGPSKEAVRNAEDAVREAMMSGTPGQRKALLKELIVEVRVESRDSIIPTFRLPATSVRVTETMVGLWFSG
jgi:site-specific DNA recombinase